MLLQLLLFATSLTEGMHLAVATEASRKQRPGSMAAGAVAQRLTASVATGTMSTDVAVQWLKDHAAAQAEIASDDYLTVNAELALKVRRDDVNDELFLRNVLPYRQLDEPVVDWRSRFYEKLKHHLDSPKTLRELADAVIPDAFVRMGKEIKFQGNSTPAVMAPNETLARGYASCTGLSIFVADALRSVGVPARVVGTPEWNLTTGGNHNWIEAWLGDGWHYTDAAPVTQVEWDKAWFTSTNTQLAIPGSKLHGIFTPVWDKDEADATYELSWREPHVDVPAVELTEAYKNLASSPWNPKWEPYRAGSEDLR